jgi:hypothetical protein
MSYRNLFFTLILGLCTLVIYGCPALLIGGAAGGGAVGYIAGELKSTEEVSLTRAWGASQEGMKDMGYAITHKERDPSGVQFQLTARGADDKKITVTLIKKADTLTEIRIRVGTFGDEQLSIKILDSIKKRL